MARFNLRLHVVHLEAKKHIYIYQKMSFCRRLNLDNLKKIYTSIADNERFGQGMKKVREGGVFGY